VLKCVPDTVGAMSSK